MSQRLVLTAQRAAHDGVCVARHEGRVVFVRHALPGEQVVVELTDAAPDARYWRGEAVEVVQPAPGRRPSPCPHSGPGGCGGCDWLHADDVTELSIKTSVLRDALARQAGVQTDAEVVAVPPRARWRTRATLHTDADGRLGLRAARSHRVVPIGDCRQLDERLDVAGLAARSWPPGQRIMVAVDDSGQRFVLGEGAEATGDGPAALDGSADRQYEVAGRRYQTAPDGFWQGHRAAAQLLADVVQRWLAPQAGDRVVDLYAGVGVFGIGMARALGERGRVDVVESDRAAAARARDNAADLPWVRVWNRPVLQWARRHRATGPLVVLDPPRAGAGPKTVRAVAAWRPRRVAYVSCEVTTLARDLVVFAELGYSVAEVAAFDLFPGTSHFETAVRLEPAPSGR